LSGHPAAAWKYDIEKGESSRYDLPAFAAPEIRYGEALVSESTSGGGFGNPLKRDPEKVLHRVKEGWITKEFAKRVYGVKVYIDSGVMKVDYEETNKLRNELKN
jgi:N-methylhydantoinase B